MLDAIHFEDQGKPAAFIATSGFVRLSDGIKRARNRSDLPVVVVPHPLGGEPEAAEKAKLAAPQIVRSIVR